jgi:hypothetical protein
MRRRKRHGMQRSAFSTRSSNSARGSTHHHRIAQNLLGVGVRRLNFRQSRRSAGEWGVSGQLDVEQPQLPLG